MLSLIRIKLILINVKRIKKILTIINKSIKKDNTFIKIIILIIMFKAIVYIIFKLTGHDFTASLYFDRKDKKVYLSYVKDAITHIRSLEKVVVEKFYIDSNKKLKDVMCNIDMSKIDHTDINQHNRLCSIKNHVDCTSFIFKCKRAIKTFFKKTFDIDVFKNINLDNTQIIGSVTKVDFKKIVELNDLFCFAQAKGQFVDLSLLNWYEMKAYNDLYECMFKLQKLKNNSPMDPNFDRFELLEKFYFSVKKAKLDEVSIEKIRKCKKLAGCKAQMKKNKIYNRSDLKLQKEHDTLLLELQKEMDTSFSGIIKSKIWNFFKDCLNERRESFYPKKYNCDELKDSLTKNYKGYYDENLQYVLDEVVERNNTFVNVLRFVQKTNYDNLINSFNKIKYLSNKKLISIIDDFSSNKNYLGELLNFKSAIINEELSSNIANHFNNIKSLSNENYKYKTTFPNLRSENLIYLSMWQYWWWFWFIFLIIIYYFFFTKLIFNRLSKINPKIFTSIKSHGRWGDFIIGAIPIYWCLNILMNSNMLLKMTEWQIESNVFSLRIRGKQWYWIYKVDAINNSHFKFLSKTIGNNRHVLNTGSLKLEEKFFKVIEQQTNRKYIKKKYLLKTKKQIENNLPMPYKNFKKVSKIKKYYKHNYSWMNNTFKLKKNYNNYVNKNIIKEVFVNKVKTFNVKNIIKHTRSSHYYLYRTYKKVKFTFNQKLTSNILIQKSNKKFLSKKIRPNKKWRAKLLAKRFYLNFAFNKVWVSTNILDLKRYHNCTHISFKTERISLANKSDFVSNNIFPSSGFKKINNVLKEEASTKISTMNYEKSFYNREYIFFNKNKWNSSSRLLTSKQVLVLPANIDISITTNSFDVVHSWFVPGLGIKMDCVPGRSTHHTFLFELYGLFFGQCAEICGRFHHHMPIQLAIVHYEIFVLWWNNIAKKKFFKKKKFSTL